MRESESKILVGEILEDIDLVVLLLSVICDRIITYFVLPYFPLHPLTVLPYVIFAIYYIHGLCKRVQVRTSDKHLPMIFVTGEREVNREQLLSQAEDAIRRKTGFDKFNAIERYFLVSLWRSVHWRRMPRSEEEWMDYIEDGIERINWLYDRVMGRKIYHLFLGRPSVMALGLGAVMGRWERPPVIVYQWINDGYKPVLDLSREPRKIKVRINLSKLNKVDLKYTEVDLPQSPGSEIALGLEMAGHPIESDVRRYIQKLGEIEVIIVKNKYRGYLADEDWTEAVQELYSIIAELRDRGVEKLHLFPSMPEAMAFGLGYALGPYWDIKVYNWVREKNTYELVFSLNRLPELSIE